MSALPKTYIAEIKQILKEARARHITLSIMLWKKPIGSLDGVLWRKYKTVNFCSVSPYEVAPVVLDRG
jgi:hypothetical protein